MHDALGRASNSESAKSGPNDIDCRCGSYSATGACRSLEKFCMHQDGAVNDFVARRVHGMQSMQRGERVKGPGGSSHQLWDKVQTWKFRRSRVLMRHPFDTGTVCDGRQS